MLVTSIFFGSLPFLFSFTAQPIEESDESHFVGSGDQSDDLTQSSDQSIIVTCDDLLKTNFWHPIALRQFITNKADRTFQSNIVKNEETQTKHWNETASFDYSIIFEQFVDEFQICAGSSKMEQALNDFWLQEYYFAMENVKYNLRKIMSFPEQFGDQLRKLVSDQNNGENVKVLLADLSMNYQDICLGFVAEVDCVESVQQIFDEGIMKEVEFEDDDSELSQGGISPSLFDNENISTGSIRMWVSVTVFLAGVIFYM